MIDSFLPFSPPPPPPPPPVELTNEKKKSNRSDLSALILTKKIAIKKSRAEMLHIPYELEADLGAEGLTLKRVTHHDMVDTIPSFLDDHEKVARPPSRNSTDSATLDNTVTSSSSSHSDQQKSSWAHHKNFQWVSRLQPVLSVFNVAFIAFVLLTIGLGMGLMYRPHHDESAAATTAGAAANASQAPIILQTTMLPQTTLVPASLATYSNIIRWPTSFPTAQSWSQTVAPTAVAPEVVVVPTPSPTHPPPHQMPSMVPSQNLPFGESSSSSSGGLFGASETSDTNSTTSSNNDNNNNSNSSAVVVDTNVTAAKCSQQHPTPPRLPGKKGIGYTLRPPEMAGSGRENLPKVLDLNVYWNYDWALEYFVDESSESDFPGAMEFVPMMWSAGSNDNDTRAALNSLLPGIQSGSIQRLLGFNEPDQEVQANMPVERVLELWPYLEALDVPLVSPSCAYMQGEWMNSFMSQAVQNCLRIDWVGVHWYGNANANVFKNNLEAIYEKWGKPVLITEFAPADFSATTLDENGNSAQDVLDFAKIVIPWLEAQDWIVGYAWFPFPMDEPCGASSALFNASGSLTPLGQFYASVSTDNPNGKRFLRTN